MNSQSISHTQSPSYGFELQPRIKTEVETILETKLASHVQVSIPNWISLEEAKSVHGSADIIVHGNLLNVLGENNWSELKVIAKQIRDLNPIQIVEHLTAFRSTNGRRSGLHFSSELMNSKAIEMAAENVMRWQDILKMPIALENIAISEHVAQYFDFLFEVKHRAKCLITCDVPHFFISMRSANFSELEVSSLARDLDPIQIHLCGLKTQNEIVDDNHSSLSPWLMGYARNLFKGVRFITLEQSPALPGDAVIKSLKILKEMSHDGRVPENFTNVHGRSIEECNEELADSARKVHYLPKFSRTSVQNSPVSSSIDILERYAAFFSPMASLNESLNEMTPKAALKSLASISKWSLSYLSWWLPSVRGIAKISYGEGTKKIFESTILGEQKEICDDDLTDFVFHRFESNKGFWIEVAAPKISVV